MFCRMIFSNDKMKKVLAIWFHCRTLYPYFILEATYPLKSISEDYVGIKKVKIYIKR